MEAKEFIYELNGKKYIQRAIVPGQAKQLFAVMQSIIIPGSADNIAFVVALGDKLPVVAACVLRADAGNIPWLKVDNSLGIPRLVEDADSFSAFAFEIGQHLSIETAVKVVSDFFDCNPTALLLERLTGIENKIASLIKPIGSKTSSVSSAPEISPGASGSSGDIP